MRRKVGVIVYSPYLAAPAGDDSALWIIIKDKDLEGASMQPAL